MVRYAFVAMAATAAALPLNINLGAYSPALVVGDGEISFGGNQDVSNLMNVLEGAAVNAASGVANRPAAATNNEAAAANDAAAVSGDATVNAAAAAAADPQLQEQAQQIASLQGLGKEIAPRVQLVDVETDADADGEVSSGNKAKRDLAGFDRALTFAEAALTKGPKIQLGTGKEGSGVGILVDNNPQAAARAGTGAGVVEKRDVPAAVAAAAPKRVRAKVTTMYVRSGIPASLQSKREAIEDDSASHGVLAAAEVPPAVQAPVQASRRSDAIDAVNLNVDGDQGLTMTFVETVEDGVDN